MFKRILVALDGSPYSNYAIPLAAQVAKCFGSEVFILHVHEREAGRAGAFPLESLEDADRVIANAINAVNNAGLKQVSGEVQHAVYGHAAKHIVETAKEKDCQLIVMGSRGLSDIAGLMLGSVTHKVLQLADAPVLVARGGDANVERILVGAGQGATAS